MQQKSIIKSPRNNHLLCSVLTVLCAVYQHFAFNIYADGDNFGISLVLNGLYGKNNICQFLNPILSVAVKFPAKLFPSADCFALLCWIFMMAAVYASFLFVLERLQGPIKKAEGILTVFLLVFVVYKGVFCNFTIQTAIISAVGWLYMLSEIRSEQIRKGRVVFALVLLGFGFMLRDTSAYLMLPFVALALAAEVFDFYLKERKLPPYLKKNLRVLISALIVFASLVVIQYAVLYSPKYKAAVEFNMVRVGVTDFPLLPYDQTALEGISENDYNSLRNWVLADTDIVTTDYFKTIAENAGTDGWAKFDHDSKIPVKQILSSISNTVPMLMKCFLFLLLLEAVTDNRTSPVKRLAIVLAYVGAGVIILYFSYAGRLLERVSLSIAMGVFLVRGALTEEIAPEGKKRPLHTALLALLAVFTLLCCVKAVLTTDYLPVASFMSAKKVESVESYEKDNVLYIWNASLDSTGSTEIGKLPSKEHLKHNIMVGGWEYGQSYFNELLHDIHAENPMKALLYRENTYYVDSVPNIYVLNWLREHYDENTQMESIGKTDGYDIWKFSIADENANR